LRIYLSAEKQPRPKRERPIHYARIPGIK
jgi:hypothetical protein